MFFVSQLAFFGTILIHCSLVFLQGCNSTGSFKNEGLEASPEIDSLSSALIALYDEGHATEADQILDSLFLANTFNSRYALKKYYGLKGQFRLKEGRFEEALAFSNKYLSNIDTTNFNERYEYARELTSHGSIYFQLGNYNAAYRYYHKARKIYSDNECFVGYSDYSIAMVLYRQGDFVGAAKTFRAALEGYQSCTFTFERQLRKQEILSNTGLCYYELSKFDSALLYYDSAQTIVNTFSTEEAVHKKWQEIATGVVAGNKARAFAGLGMLDSAYYYTMMDISINLRPTYDQYDGVVSLLHLASLHYQTGRAESMDTVLTQADSNIHRLGSPVLRLRWFQLKKNYFSSLHRWDSTAYYADQYIVLSDSISTANSKAFDTHIQLALQGMDSEYELGRLNQKNNFNQRSLGYLLVILGLAVLAIIVTIVFLASSKKKNTALADKSLELEKANIELQHRNTEKDRILGIAAHDLRTPVGAILSLTSFLRAEGMARSEYLELVDLIETASQSSMGLINEILLLADLKQNPLVKEEVAVNPFLKRTIELIKFKADEKKQKVKLEMLANDATIQADPERLRRALSNLVSNAIKFSNENSPITVKAAVSDEAIVFSVADNGIGIPESMKKELFKSFTKAKREGTNGERPFGLGLSIVKQIIEGHSGSVWLESIEGEGSTFFVEIPMN
jgi:signal transduction histidine kinase